MSKPTNLSFDRHDKFELKPFCDRMIEFITVEHEFVEGSLVVSLDAPFGSGKSTFLSMWRTYLESNQAPSPKAIMLNAWESDFCGDPLLSVMTGLIEFVSIAEPDKGGILTEAMKDISWFTLGLAGTAITGLARLAGHTILGECDPFAAAKFAKEKNDARNPTEPDVVKLYEQRRDSLRRLKQALQKTFGGAVPKAYVFVDELDRCRPDYAISYLETIKHIFDVNGLVFILAVDRDQLESSAKALFGEGLNFPEYFRKFVQRSFTLPFPKEPSLQQLVEHYVERYIHKSGKRLTRINIEEFKEKTVELIVSLRATPRQIQEIFRIIGHASSQKESEGYYTQWGTCSALILLATFKVLNHKLYFKIGERILDIQEVRNYLKNLDETSLAWWSYMFISGTKPNSLPSSANANTQIYPVDLSSVLTSYGLSKTTQGASFKETQFRKPWENNHNGNIWWIYDRIEGACEI